ncbi:hypothetical protein N8T08_004603 [Aspergillus melleus]|uniref:Uncharacterized protein n=1 Tax=Aspergillus melleus TaxID=138277 RepID=A0ACC3B4L6_9EURO|nr:hypothetical protein N8T08_004603 [Aspergillus melleus]
MNNQVSKSAEGRRRRTVFRKLRKFCNEFDVCAVVVLTDNMNRQFIFKTHDDTPAFGNILEHPRTRTNDDFQALGPLSDQAFEPTALDHVILQNGGRTVNLERLSSNLKQSKLDSPPSVPDLHREIGRLRQELAFHQEAHMALNQVFSDAREVYQLIQEALLRASNQHKLWHAFIIISSTTKHAGGKIHRALNQVSEKLAALETDLLLSYGVTLDDTHKKDYSIV